MHRADKWRKMRKMSKLGAWPYVAAMGASGRGWEDAYGPDGPFGRGGPFGPGGPFGKDGGGRRRRRMFGSGELRLVMLKLLADEPRHGYELIKAVEDLTGGSYAPSPGTVYPTLSLLEDEGAIFQSTSDTADILPLLAQSTPPELLSAILESLETVRGAFSMVVLTPQALYAVRDPYGFRPQ